MSTQPDALELARWTEKFCRNVKDPEDFRWKAMANMAAELRRLHDENAQLREQNTALDAACAKMEAVRGTPATGGEPVAWRYQDARGHYRYRGYVPRFDKDYALLKPIPLYTSPQPVREPLTPEQIDAAAKMMAECMDYPWDFMPERGRSGMRKRAVAVIEAAHGITGGKP